MILEMASLERHKIQAENSCLKYLGLEVFWVLILEYAIDRDRYGYGYK